MGLFKKLFNETVSTATNVLKEELKEKIGVSPTPAKSQETVPCTSVTPVQPQDLIGLRFYNQNMSIYTDNYGNRFLLDSQGQRELQPDIYKVNSLLSRASSLVNVYFKIDMINFMPNARSESCINFTWMDYIPFTPKGKKSKYPAVLHFTDGRDSFDSDRYIFGKIYYLVDGSIGKATIINWINHNCFTVELGLIGLNLDIFRVVASDNNGNKIKLYDYKNA